MNKDAIRKYNTITYTFYITNIQAIIEQSLRHNYVSAIFSKHLVRRTI